MFVAVGDAVEVDVGVFVSVLVAVPVTVDVAVEVAVGVGVTVAVAVTVEVGVAKIGGGSASTPASQKLAVGSVVERLSIRTLTFPARTTSI